MNKSEFMAGIVPLLVEDPTNEDFARIRQFGLENRSCGSLAGVKNATAKAWAIKYGLQYLEFLREFSEGER